MRPLHAALCSVVIGLSAAGCYATVQPEPVYADATYVPPDIDTYPYVIYEGRPVYFVHDHWYVRHGPRWVYYRNEPSSLHRQRPYVQRAPRAYRRPEYAAPPVQRAPAPAREAPPAREVR